MPERARAMAARLADTAARLGVDRDGRDLIARAFEAGMAPRIDAGLDDHHPDFLHTARTALILMDDTGAADPATLAAALVTETREADLRMEEDEVRRLGEDVAALAAAVPDPAAEGLIERLVTADPALRLVALAERLDHARHLHLRDPGEWAAYHALTCAAYAPVAGRAHPVLERRFTHWCRTFARRFTVGG